LSIVDVGQVYVSEIKATVDALVIPEVHRSLRVQLLFGNDECQLKFNAKVARNPVVVR
jgi:hypothetical protein